MVPSLRRTCLAALLLLTVAWSPADEDSDATQRSGNNGLAFNGLATNGLAFNGLATNGLAFNGLNSEAFTTWFREDPTTANMVMHYMVQCAVPQGEFRAYEGEDQTYVWQGALGLAPGWAGGAPATELEQQLISACLAAHANKYGKRVLISVLGSDAQGNAISYTDEELKRFSVKEGCFFGNLFTGEGVYVGNHHKLLDTHHSSARACALGQKEDDPTVECDPLYYVGSCKDFCEMDGTKAYFTSCKLNGTTYTPITTRLRKDDIYKCGDGICQFTESCGNGKSANSCQEDCGTCD
jgi:hypothetical protein